MQETSLQQEREGREILEIMKEIPKRYLCGWPKAGQLAPGRFILGYWEEIDNVVSEKKPSGSGCCFSVVRALAWAPKCHGFGFWSGACIQVTDPISGPCGGVCGRQPFDASLYIDVSMFLSLLISLSIFLPPSLLFSLKNRWQKIFSGKK